MTLPADAASVEAILAACERELASRGAADLRGLGFWRAVEATKRDPSWTARFAERIAAIDRRAFLARTRVVIPLRLGVAILALGAAAGVVLLVVAFALEPTPAGIAILAGTGALIGTTHDLAHLAAGRLAGIRFSDAYTGLPRRPQPGVKIDYASYLRASPRGRAWMHASGAIATKVVPFLAVPVALAARAPSWTAGLLVVVGVAQLVTDALFSLRGGDWKKFRRELRLAQGPGRGPRGRKPGRAPGPPMPPGRGPNPRRGP